MRVQIDLGIGKNCGELFDSVRTTPAGKFVRQILGMKRRYLWMSVAGLFVSADRNHHGLFDLACCWTPGGSVNPDYRRFVSADQLFVSRRALRKLYANIAMLTRMRYCDVEAREAHARQCVQNE